jgi:diadenosine tetraphosphate (Ap4A) HIT family hydrolase
MPTLFTRIIRGELPGRFVYQDDRAVAFLTLRPLQAGHTLVVPREEVDHWLDLPVELAAHVMHVSQRVGRGIQKAFSPVKVGIAVVGLEVPHVHVHLVPLRTMGDLDFSKQQDVPGAELDQAAERLRAALRELKEPNVAG